MLTATSADGVVQNIVGVCVEMAAMDGFDKSLGSKQLL
jgi:hypothetical protein